MTVKTLEQDDTNEIENNQNENDSNEINVGNESSSKKK